MTSAPTSMTGLRKKPRISVWRKVCTWVISLVTRVIREPVENRSMSEKEKVWIRAKASLRTPAATRADPRTAKNAPSTPKASMAAAISSI